MDGANLNLNSMDRNLEVIVEVVIIRLGHDRVHRKNTGLIHRVDFAYH